MGAVLDAIGVCNVNERYSVGNATGQRMTIPLARNRTRGTPRHEVPDHWSAKPAYKRRSRSADSRRKAQRSGRPITHPYLSKTHRDPSGSIESVSRPTPLLTTGAEKSGKNITPRHIRRQDNAATARL